MVLNRPFLEQVGVRDPRRVVVVAGHRSLQIERGDGHAAATGGRDLREYPAVKDKPVIAAGAPRRLTGNRASVADQQWIGARRTRHVERRAVPVAV